MALCNFWCALWHYRKTLTCACLSASVTNYLFTGLLFLIYSDQWLETTVLHWKCCLILFDRLRSLGGLAPQFFHSPRGFANFVCKFRQRTMEKWSKLYGSRQPVMGPRLSGQDVRPSLMKFDESLRADQMLKFWVFENLRWWRWPSWKSKNCDISALI